MPNLDLGQIVKEHGSKAALDQIEQEKARSVEAEVTGDKTAEVDVNVPITNGPAIFKGGTVTGFARYVWETVKDFSWGARFTKKF